MTVRMLLKSCATPPASWPMASIFCDWRNCSSSRRWAVTSRNRLNMSSGRLVDFDERIGDFQHHGLAVVQDVLALRFCAGRRG